MKFYTIPEVARLAHTSAPTVRRWIKEEKLAVTQVGNRIVVEEQWLKQWMLTPENALTYDDCVDLGVDIEIIESVLACQDREQVALAQGATELSQVAPPSQEMVRPEAEGIFRKRQHHA